MQNGAKLDWVVAVVAAVLRPAATVEVRCLRQAEAVLEDEVGAVVPCRRVGPVAILARVGLAESKEPGVVPAGIDDRAPRPPPVDSGSVTVSSKSMPMVWPFSSS